MAVDPITALLSVGESVIERIWPDANKRSEQVLKLKEMAEAGDLARLEAEVKLLTSQLDVNKAEAQHKSLFVAGWRPFVGWVGGMSFAYAAIVEPVFRFVAAMSGYDGSFPVLDTDITIQVLMGMLGLGIMRSFDKMKGVETNSLGKLKPKW